MFVEPYLANVTMFAGNFAPRGWAFCQGQLMSIAEYTALYALIGTTYGGDGQTTFGLPDLRGRFAIHPGQAPGLSPYVLGQMAGTESVTILSSQLASHTHPYVSAAGNPTANNSNGNLDSPTNNVPAVVVGSSLYNTAASSSVMGTSHCTSNTVATGGNQPTPIMSPYLVLNYIIAIEGIFPSRN